MKNLETLFVEIADRKRNPVENSNTSKLFAGGVHEIGKKVVEEAAEVWMAAEYQNEEECAIEISQLLYHLSVMAVERGLSLADIYKYL